MYMVTTRAHRRLTTSLLAVFAACLWLAPLAPSQVTWDGQTDANWSVPTNWSTDTEPTLATAVLFSSPVPSTGSVITLSAGEQALSLAFQESYTLNGGDLTLAAVSSITVDPTFTATINSVLAGAATSLAKNGNGTLILSGANTFAGTLTLNAGVLRATTSASALGAGGLTLSGGELQLADDAAVGFGRNTTVTGNTQITSDRLTAGAGVTHTMGTLSIGGQTLTIAKGSNSTSGTAGITFGNTTLTGNATINTGAGALTTIAGTVTMGTNGLTIGGAGNTTITGSTGPTTSNSGTITKNDSGTLRITADPNNTGLLTINGGVVELDHSGTTDFGTVINSAGTLRTITAATGDSQDITVNTLGTYDFRVSDTIGGLSGGGLVTKGSGGNGTLTVNAGNESTTFSGEIQNGAGTVLLAKNGTGTLTLTGENKYTGSTTLLRGTLALDFSAPGGPVSNSNIIAGTSALILNTNTTTTSTGTLRITGEDSITNSQSFASTTVTSGTNILDFISGAGGTLNVSLGTITRTNGTLNFLAPTSGTISVGNANGLLGNWATYTSGGTTQLARVVSNTVVGAAADFVYETGVDIANVTNYSATGIMKVDNTSTGTVLQGAGTTPLHSIYYTDSASRTFDIAAGETLQFASSGTFIADAGAGQVTLGATPGAGTITAGASGNADLLLHVVDAAGRVTVNSVITNNAGSGTVTVTKAGAGEVILASANTHTGATVVMAGVLEIQNAGALGTTAAGTTVQGGAALELSGGITVTGEALAITGSGIASNGALRNVSGDNTYAGLITLGGAATIGADAGTTLTLDVASGNAINSGNNGLTFSGAGTIVVNDAILHGGSSNPGIAKSGTGTLILNAASTFTGTGALTINDGVVRITNGGALGGTTAGTSITDNASLELSGGIVTNENITMLNSTGISGSGAIHNVGGNNTITGTVITDDGNSRVMADAGTQLTISGEFRGDPSSGSNRTTTIGGGGDVILSGVVRNGTGTTPGVLTVVKDGAGTLTLSAANTYTGTTTVSAGTLNLTGSVTTSAITVAVGATFNQSVTGSMSGATSVTTSGTTSLAGTNTYTGATNINNGSLTLAGSLNGTAITVRAGATFNETATGVLAGTTSLTTAGATTLSGTNTTTGATTVTNGTLTLNYDAGGGGTNTSKLADAAVLTLGGGSVALSGGSHVEVVGSTTLTTGMRTDVSRTSGTSVLALNAVTAGAGALLNLAGNDIASTTNANVNGILGPWAMVTIAGETDFATNSGVSDGVTGGGLIRAYTGYTDIPRLGPTSVVPDDATLNVRIVNGGTSGPITLASTATEINTLQMDASEGPAVIDPANATDILMIGGEGGGAILQTAASGGLTIGAAVGDGRLTTGGTANTTPAGLVIINESTANALTINSIITNNGTDVVNILKGGAGTLVLSAANTYTGGTRLDEGIIRATTSASALGSGGTVTIASGELQLANNANLNFARTVSMVGSATFTSDRLAAGAGVTHSLGGLDFNANNITLTFRKGDNVTSGTAGITFTGQFNTNGNSAVIDVGADFVLTMSGSNSASPADASSVITKTGAGTWIISGNNSWWEGPTMVVSQGTLDLRNANAIGDNNPATQLITLANATILRLGVDASTNFNTDLTLTGTGSTATLIADRNAAGAGNTHTMDSLNLGSNTLLVQRGSNVTSGTETVVFDAVSTVGAGATINTVNVDVLISAAISGAGGTLTKTGASQLTLSGVNTYTGATTVTEGTLQIGAAGVGSLAATSSLNVNGSTAVLAGTGTVNGSTTVAQGVIRPGDTGGSSVGTLNLAGGLTFSPSAAATVAELQISGPSTSDFIHITGDLALNSNSNIAVLPSSYTATLGDSFLLMDWTGLLTLNGWTAGINFRDGSSDTGTNLDLPDIASSGYLWDISTLVDGATGGSLRITVIAVPEPSRLLLLAGAFVAAMLRRRR